ncbi:hypothetical protein FQZ97_756390 [compost metagenome]
MLHQDLAAGVVVIHYQQTGTLQRAVEVGRRPFETLAVQRQGQPQGRALGAAALDAELTMHQAHQLAGDDQAEATAELGRGEEVLAVQFGIEQGVALVGL